MTQALVLTCDPVSFQDAVWTDYSRHAKISLMLKEKQNYCREWKDKDSCFCNDAMGKTEPICET